MTITIANCKGGVGKTTTSMTLAQGLSLHGHRVLAVDADPQGSLTTLFGVRPEQVLDKATLAPVLRGEIRDLRALMQPTYWPGIDLIPAAPMLFSVEHEIANAALSQGNRDGLQLLRHAMEGARSDYDVIIIDTPPSLSFLSATAILASDGLVVPAPPTALDFASLAQLWLLVADISKEFDAQRPNSAILDFLHIVPSRVDSQDVTARVVLEWLAIAYGKALSPIVIPRTAATPAAAAEFGTVYDDDFGGTSSSTRRRACRAYDDLVALVQSSIVRTFGTRATAAMLRDDEPADKTTTGERR